MKKLFSSIFKTLTFGGLAVALTVITGFFIYFAIIILWERSSESLPKSDAIIALTGGSERIESAFDLLLDNKAPRMLISGVLNKVSFREIVDARNVPAKDKPQILAHCCIDIDYIADTTATNATESAKWAQKKNVKTLILVTSASHMPRAYLQFSRVFAPDIAIYPFPVHDKKRSQLVMSQKFWLYALREYSKYLGSWVRLERQD